MSEEDVFAAINEKNLEKLRNILAVDQSAITKANEVPFSILFQNFLIIFQNYIFFFLILFHFCFLFHNFISI